MANPFDVFDAPPPGAATASANPFDRFDAPAPAAAAKPAAPPVSVAEDIGATIGPGLKRSVLGALGLPGSVVQLADEGAGWAARRLVRAMGLTPASDVGVTRESLGPQLPRIPTGEDLTRAYEEAQGAPLYTPKTKVGQYVNTVAEFATGALTGPGGLVRKAADVVVPAVLSETAGQATHGTALEPVARIAGALGGNLGNAAVAAHADAPSRTLAAAARGVTDAEFDAARRLQETGARLGVPLTGPEAIQAATGGATKLADVLRVVEGSTQGGATTARFFADRPGQVRDAAGRAFDEIAPQSAEPSTLGPRAAEAARAAIDASPEGQALADAIWRAGPRTTAADAGPSIQGGLRQTYEGREGMRAALAERDYAAARDAPEGIGIDRTVTVERPGLPVLETPPAAPRAPLRFDEPPHGPATIGSLAPARPDSASGAAGTKSLARFIAENGGIGLERGDVKAAGLDRFRQPGVASLVRQDGRSIDGHWRERLIEEGYLPPDRDGGMARNVTDEVLGLLEQEAKGRKVYPYHWTGEEAAQGFGAARDEFAASASTRTSEVRQALEASGVDPRSVERGVIDRAAAGLMRGDFADPLEAVERTVMASREPLRRPEAREVPTTVTERIPAPVFGQADPSPVLAHIDGELRSAKGAVARALRSARDTLFTRAGEGAPKELDLSVAGLQGARTAISGLIEGADPSVKRVLTGVRDRLDGALEAVPEQAAATRNFAAASEPLRPFDNPALSKVIERDEFGRSFTLPPEHAAPTLEAAGPTAVRTFADVAPPAARSDFEHYLATRLLDGASDARGAVDADALALGMRGSGDVLDAVPGVRERLEGVRTADAALGPQRRGIVGEVSRAGSTEAAGDLVLPSQPRVGGERETADAVARLQEQDAEGTAQLVRQVMADRFDRSAGRLVGGENQYGGARYAKDVAGTEAQDATLRAVLEVLDRPAAPAAVADLLNVFRATGTRKAQGSPTEFNRQTAAEIGERPVMAQALDAVRTGGASMLTHAGDASKRAWLGKNTGTLADMFVAPDSVDRIAAIVAQGAGTPFADALRRSVVQGAQISR